MKQQLTEQERFDLMIYRLQRAHETMKEALVMSRESFYNAAQSTLLRLLLCSNSLAHKE